MEEVDLRWIQTSWTSWNGEVNGGKGTYSGFSWDLVGFDLLLKKVNWSVTEDKGDFVLEDWAQDFKFWNFSTELFEVLEFFFLDAISSEFEDFFDEGVFGNDKGSVVGSKSLSDLLDLVGSNVSEVSENDLFMSSEEFIKLFDLIELFSSNLSATSHFVI